jgi:uroporphyrinogen-III synthase
MFSNIYISRDEEEIPNLSKLLIESGLKVVAKSMIKTESVPFDLPPIKTDWIFFSSRNSVRFFFYQSPDITNQKLAAIGKATASDLREFGEVSYFGDDTDTSRIAEEFAKIVLNDTVLFPQSNISQRVVQKALPESIVSEIVCYNTTHTPTEVEKCYILVFSSPSNVDSFFEKNKKYSSQKFIAFGKTTARALIEHGVDDIILPTALDDMTLFRTIIHTSGS